MHGDRSTVVKPPASAFGPCEFLAKDRPAGTDHTHRLTVVRLDRRPPHAAIDSRGVRSPHVGADDACPDARSSGTRVRREARPTTPRAALQVSGGQAAERAVWTTRCLPTGARTLRFARVTAAARIKAAATRSRRRSRKGMVPIGPRGGWLERKDHDPGCAPASGLQTRRETRRPAPSRARPSLQRSVLGADPVGPVPKSLG